MKETNRNRFWHKVAIILNPFPVMAGYCLGTLVLPGLLPSGVMDIA